MCKLVVYFEDGEVMEWNSFDRLFSNEFGSSLTVDGEEVIITREDGLRFWEVVR